VLSLVVPKADPESDIVGLLENVRAGNSHAFAQVVRAYNQRMFRIARSIVSDDDEAMDVVQEAFITAFKRLDTLKELSRFGVWVGRIARHVALMKLRSDWRYTRMDDEQLEDAMEHSLMRTASTSLPDDNMANAQLGALLERAIDQLPDSFRAVFMLRAVECCSLRETAEILEIKEATVKTRFHRARKIIQEQMLNYADVAGLNVHEFAGRRCQRIVDNVMAAINRPD